MPDTISGVWNKTVEGPGPQNTGIHDLDTHIDRVIGQHAEQSYGVIQERQRDKFQYLHDNPEVDPHNLARLPDGSLGVNTENEQAVADRANNINSKAMEWRRKRKTL